MQQPTGIITSSDGVSCVSCICCIPSNVRLSVQLTKSFEREPTRSVVVQCCDVLFMEEMSIVILDKIITSVDCE